MNVSQQTLRHEQAIDALRTALGSAVTIVGHHYQQETVVRHCDFRGDSLELARMVPGIDAEHIVFCGVYFMAESAALLARPGQQVHLPESNADCVMALMTPAAILQHVLKRLTASGRKLIPLAYANTALAVKSVVGSYGGAVCTSANAGIMLRWAMEQGDGVLFLPDKNLARNTAAVLGLSEKDIHQLDIRRRGDAADVAAANRASLVLWPGLCSIHARFNLAQIAAARKADPQCTIVVHPECSPEVVKAADAAGSTAYIIKYVAAAPEGSHIYIGTEINLVRRLSREYAGKLRVEPLFPSACSHMAKVTPAKLHRTLQYIATGTARPLVIDPAVRVPAQAAIERMLRVCAQQSSPARLK